MVKTIIAGSRSVTQNSVLIDALSCLNWVPSEVVSGTARGADRLGEVWAESVDIPVKRFPADWDKYGRSAGYRRNEEMAEYADACIILWDGESKGTKHMIDIALSKGLVLFIWRVK